MFMSNSGQPYVFNKNTTPLAVILVYFDSKGDRLLYRYPYQKICASADGVQPVYNLEKKKSSPFALSNNLDGDVMQTPPQSITTNNISKSQQHGFADEAISTLFAVKPQLCNQKFELKINDVRFVCHPTLIQRKEQRQNNPASTQNTALTNANAASTSGGAGTSAATANSTTLSIAPSATTSTAAAPAAATAAPIVKPQKQQMLINVVFALHAQASYSIVRCYHELSKRLGLALKFEEQRVGYLTEETALMARTHDEQQQLQQPLEQTLELISERSSLANALKTIYHDLCTTGLLSVVLNNNLTVSFCLPQKAHQLQKKGSTVDPETIDRCLRSLKPYHGMLLLVDPAELLDSVPPSGARLLVQLVEVYTPLTSLQSMAHDADMKIDHVYKLVSHLVYWAKATIIYPLCETNVYVIAPDAPLHTKSHLVEKFSMRFAGMSLFEAISDFSLPTSIGHLTTPLQQPARQGILAQMVLWMLQHHLLMQLHTYVQFMPSATLDVSADEYDPGDSVSFMQTVTPAALGSCGNLSDMDEMDVNDADALHAQSMLSMSSQPLPVPQTRHSITEDHFSIDVGSTASDTNVALPSSSHKSNFSMTASLSTDNCDSIDSMEDEEKIKELLQVFNGSDRNAIRRIPASTNVDDLSLMVKLYQAGYFKSEHHLEEIMYFENLRRSQLLQLLDKFRDVLIIYETEDPTIASMYNTK